MLPHLLQFTDPQTREARAQTVREPGAEKPWFGLMNKTVSLSSCSWWRRTTGREERRKGPEKQSKQAKG